MADVRRSRAPGRFLERPGKIQVKAGDRRNDAKTKPVPTDSKASTASRGGSTATSVIRCAAGGGFICTKAFKAAAGSAALTAL